MLLLLLEVQLNQPNWTHKKLIVTKYMTNYCHILFELKSCILLHSFTLSHSQLTAIFELVLLLLIMNLKYHYFDSYLMLTWMFQTSVILDYFVLFLSC